MKFNNPDAPATRKQLWLLHILTKEDTRQSKLTIKEASDKIAELKGDGHKPASNGKDYLAILKLADQVASKAYKDYCRDNYKEPRYAVVQHSNPLDDSSPVEKAWPMRDLCGVVWLDLKLKGNEKFINWFKKTGKRTGQYNKRWEIDGFGLGYNGSCSVWSYPWTLRLPGIGCGNGAISAAEESARAAVEVLGKHGVEVHMQSRLD